MKKFLVLSAIIGLAGIGIGLANQDDGSPEVHLSAPATVETTTTSSAAPAAPTAATAAVKAPAKTSGTTARPTTTTTTPRATAPTIPTTSTTQRAAAPTTTSTTVVTKKKCSVTVAQPSVMYGDQQTVTVTSILPNTPLTMTVKWNSPSKGQTFTATTDGSGGYTKTFESISGGTAVVNVRIEDPNDAFCTTSFRSEWAR